MAIAELIRAERLELASIGSKHGVPEAFNGLRNGILVAKSVHTRLVHSGGNFCIFLRSDFLNCCGDRRLIVEV